MANKYPKSEYVIKRDNALLQPCRISDKVVDVPREQPCNIIVVHGVNDVGTSYGAVEEWLCAGLQDRLLRKFKTAENLVPQPVFRKAAAPTKLGIIYYGSTTPAMREALDVLEANGDHVDAMRLCAFPFPDSVREFIAAHDKVFVAEQNRDAQMRTMLINELEVNPAKLVRVLHYDGTPITARFIIRNIHDHVQKETV